MWFHLPWCAVESWVIKMHESFSFEPDQELQLFSDLKPGSRSDFCFQCTVSARCCSTYFPLVLWDEDLPGACSFCLPLSAVVTQAAAWDDSTWLSRIGAQGPLLLEKWLGSELGQFSLQFLGTGRQTETFILSQALLATSKEQIMQKMTGEAAMIPTIEQYLYGTFQALPLCKNTVVT